MRAFPLVLVGVALVLFSGAPQAAPGKAAAQAIAIQLTLPGQQPIVFGGVTAPPDATVTSGTIIYPADGSVVNATSVSESASANPAATAARATVDGGHFVLFNGEITADALAARANASAPGRDFDGSSLTNLVVLGQPVQPAPNLKLQLADWGHATVLEQTAREVALEVVLDAAHGNLPAGSRIELGVVEAAAVAAPPPPTSTATAPPPPRTTGVAHAPRPAPAPASAPAPKAKTRPAARPTPKRKQPKATKPKPKAVKSQPLPPSVHPNLGPGLYVFPVYGPAGYGDTYAAARSDVTYHHGDDIFAPLGAPVLAVADGTIYSVGWERLGGNRLWLRDSHGNEFYYAHLAAFSTLAVNGLRVQAGDVIGFVGNTGDAEGTEYHLHFEVHPVSFLFLDYDGAVDPTKYLDGWRRIREVRLRPAVGGGPPLATRSGPPPGAVLLQSVDISRADGLDPGSLQRVLSGGTG